MRHPAPLFTSRKPQTTINTAGEEATFSTVYVTLQGSSACGPAQDGLYIYDIKNITAPVQKSLLPLSDPLGLVSRIRLYLYAVVVLFFL